MFLEPEFPVDDVELLDPVVVLVELLVELPVLVELLVELPVLVELLELELPEEVVLVVLVVVVDPLELEEEELDPEVGVWTTSEAL